MAQVHNIVKKTPGGKLSMKTLEALGLPDPVRNMGEAAEEQDAILKRQENRAAQARQQQHKTVQEARMPSVAAPAAPKVVGGAASQRKNKSLLAG